MWMTSRTGSVGWDLRKSQLVETETWGRRDEFVRYGRRTWWGGEADEKVSIERLCLSPYVEKPFNSKVIKSFVPELRSRKCFCVSGFLCYLHRCVMNILSTFHVFKYGYVTTPLNKGKISLQTSVLDTYGTKPHMMVRLLPMRFWECWVSLHWNNSQFHFYSVW